jgi:hypothetical protein
MGIGSDMSARIADKIELPWPRCGSRLRVDHSDEENRA